MHKTSEHFKHSCQDTHWRGPFDNAARYLPVLSKNDGAFWIVMVPTDQLQPEHFHNPLEKIKESYHSKQMTKVIWLKAAVFSTTFKNTCVSLTHRGGYCCPLEILMGYIM